MTAVYGIPAENITVIPNGVDIDYFRPPEVKPAGPPVLVCVARLHRDKDHTTLFKALQMVREKFPEVRLWLVGDGLRRGALQNWVEKNFPPGTVEFFGAQMDIRPYLHQASLLVLSSIREAMPNAILEAMASGLPVVATRVGGVPEVVRQGETGLLVPPNAPGALGEAICRILADPSWLSALGEGGRRRAQEEFSIEIMVRCHEAVFDQLVNHTRGGPPMPGSSAGALWKKESLKN
jgi:glycosyltransferase involved in cell wall biosynthesis